METDICPNSNSHKVSTLTELNVLLVYVNLSTVGFSLYLFIFLSERCGVLFSSPTPEIGWQAVLADCVVRKAGLFSALIKRGVECRRSGLLGELLLTANSKPVIKNELTLCA